MGLKRSGYYLLLHLLMGCMSASGNRTGEVSSAIMTLSTATPTPKPSTTPAPTNTPNVTLLSQASAAALFGSGNVTLEEGTYILPINFTLDLGTTDLKISGVPGKTIITSYDGTAATNFNVIPLDTSQVDNHPDGIYVVTKHPTYSYGGGFAHIELTYNTDGQRVLYTQGTILQKTNGVWTRHYTGAGFMTKGNVSVSGITFENCQFYLFSPFGLTRTQNFEIKNSKFKNIGRVLASSQYAGIGHAPNWYNALNYYSVDGTFRFSNFILTDNTFENIHTSIVWGLPPSETVKITRNVVKNSHAIAFFNLFMKNYNDPYYFNTRSTQLISENTFIDISQNNNWTTQLIRTSGIATIENNNFIDTTPQVAFFYGGDSSFVRNRIKKLNTPNENQSPVILVKSANAPSTKAATNTFRDNTVTAPNSFFLALEGGSNNIVTDNQLNVKTVFSKNDSTQGASQFIKISKNHITSSGLTNVAANSAAVTFQSMHVTENFLTNTIHLHTGNTGVTDYIFSENVLINTFFTPAVPQALSFIFEKNTLQSCPQATSCNSSPASCVPIPMVDSHGCVMDCGQYCI